MHKDYTSSGEDHNPRKFSRSRSILLVLCSVFPAIQTRFIFSSSEDLAVEAQVRGHSQKGHWTISEQAWLLYSAVNPCTLERAWREVLGHIYQELSRRCLSLRAISPISNSPAQVFKALLHWASMSTFSEAVAISLVSRLFWTHVLIYFSYSTTPQVMVATSDGYLYQYNIDLDNGGPCVLLKQYSLLESTEDFAGSPGSDWRWQDCASARICYML